MAGCCGSRNNNAQHNHRSQTHAVSASIEDECAVKLAAFLVANYVHMATAAVAAVVVHFDLYH